jgi:hypothetical protein
MNFKDLTGKQFNRLVVLSRAEDKISKSGKHRTMWNCKCECGNEFKTLSESLTRNPNLVCPECTNKNRSNNNRINVVGNKYRRLTILNIIPDSRPTKVRCKCDCGNEHVCLQADVVNGHTQSCGCLQSEMASIATVKDWAGYVADSGVEFIQQGYMNDSGQWVWQCRCGLCGNMFYELPAKINNGHTTSCGCRKESFGESYIKELLEEKDIKYQSQYIFDDCRYIYPLRFDFAIFYNNKLLGLIEYDGRQHFEPIEFFGGEDEFVKRKKRDEIKNNYCNVFNIQLLRLPYTLSTQEIKEKLYKYYESLTTAGCA